MLLVLPRSGRFNQITSFRFNVACAGRFFGTSGRPNWGCEMVAACAATSGHIIDVLLVKGEEAAGLRAKTPVNEA